MFKLLVLFAFDNEYQFFVGTYFLAAQCHREERAGGREPAAGLRHRRPPCRPRHLTPHHLPRQVRRKTMSSLIMFSSQERHRHHPSLLSLALSQGKQKWPLIDV